VNLFEVVLFIVVFVAGVVCAGVAGQRFGGVGLVLGFAVGSATTLLVLRVLLRRGNEAASLPPCRMPEDRKHRYRAEKGTDGEALFECSCGACYVLDAKHFTQLLKDGSLRPYMKRSRRGARWEMDL